MKKLCKVCNAYQVYARGYCKLHYFKLYLAPKQKLKAKYPLPHKDAYKIPQRTPKRLKQEDEYRIKRKLFIEAKKSENKGKLYCIFCGKIITGEPSLHHSNGRDNNKLLNVLNWYLSHNFCHVHQYHSMSWTKIPWWNDYIDRIKKIDPDLYQKELIKMKKK